LHYLRRIASHLDLRRKLPAPGDGDPSTDSVLAEYYRLVESPPRSALGRLFSRSPSRNFDHVIYHSDAEGYYLPGDFRGVVLGTAAASVGGGLVRSSVTLRD